MELANRPSIYKRSESPGSQTDACSYGIRKKCTPGNAARGLVSRPKNRPARPIWGAPRPPPCPSRTPIFRFFTPFLKIFKNFFAPSARRCLPCAEPSRRTLAWAENPGIPRQNAPSASHSCLVAAPKSPAKHPSRAPKTPPLTPLRIKKLSKVRSTLLTRPPRECILEYMRLKEPRRPPHAGRHA